MFAQLAALLQNLVTQTASAVFPVQIQMKIYAKAKKRAIICETKWKDNDRNADLRETMIIGTNEFSVTKEVRYENTTDYFVRNKHSYRRK